MESDCVVSATQNPLANLQNGSVAVCLFLPYIQSSISFEYSNNTFYLTIKLTISSMDFTENDPDITT